jgi:hypothetical protein
MGWRDKASEIIASTKTLGKRGVSAAKRGSLDAVGYVGAKAPEAWKSTRSGAKTAGSVVRRGLTISWDRLSDSTSDGARWMKKNAPAAWAHIESGAGQIKGAWQEHSDEISGRRPSRLASRRRVWRR